MKWVVNILVIVLFLCTTSLFASNKKEDLVNIYFKNELVGSYTINQFESLILNNEFLKETMESEKHNRVIIELADDTFTFDSTNTYTGFIYVKWLKSDNVSVIKEIKLNVKLTLDKRKMSFKDKIWNKYKDISTIGFPFSVIVVIILVVLI